jgi:hypothetical protein
VPARPRGPLSFCQLSGLLARLDPAGVGVRRQDRQDLGRQQQRVPADARGPWQ